MTDVFITVLNCGWKATLVIAVVLLVRALIARLPKKYSYLLWSLVAIRLFCIWSVESSLSLFNYVGDKGTGISGEWQEETQTATEWENIGQSSKNPVLVTENSNVFGTSADRVWKSEKPDGTVSVFLSAKFIKYGAFLWGAGALILLLFRAFQLWLIRRRVANAVRLDENVYECDNIPSPFVFGIIRPCIFLPFRLAKEQREYVIAHEKYHIARKDHWVKAAAVFLTCVYWFHPLVWVSFVLMVRDMEMSCDEQVLRESSVEVRKSYSRSLLEFATNQRAGVLMFFGESVTRKRVRNVLAAKKNRKWYSLLTAGVLIIVGVVCLTDSKKIEPADVQSGQNAYFTLEEYVLWGVKQYMPELIVNELNTLTTTAVSDDRIMMIGDAADYEKRTICFNFTYTEEEMLRQYVCKDYGYSGKLNIDALEPVSSDAVEKSLRTFSEYFLHKNGVELRGEYYDADKESEYEKYEHFVIMCDKLSDRYDVNTFAAYKDNLGGSYVVDTTLGMVVRYEMEQGEL